MNLLVETVHGIKGSGHVPEDIVFIGSLESAHACTWSEFQILADIEYNCGFGAQKIATDLTIVFSDGNTMWRDEYDGSEDWQYSAPARIPEITQPIKRLTTEGAMWASLEDLHNA